MEIDRIIFTPIRFTPERKLQLTPDAPLLWNVPMIFDGFEDFKSCRINYKFLDILRVNPKIRDIISSIEFLEYMFHPVIRLGQETR